MLRWCLRHFIRAPGCCWNLSRLACCMNLVVVGCAVRVCVCVCVLCDVCVRLLALIYWLQIQIHAPTFLLCTTFALLATATSIYQGVAALLPMVCCCHRVVVVGLIGWSSFCVCVCVCVCVCAFVFSSPCSLPEKHHTLDVCALLFCWRWGPGFATLACCGPLFRRYLSVFVVRLGSSNCLPWPHCRG